MRRYTVNSFFAGIGGFDLAFEAAGFDITLQVEIDDFCQRILTKHWPDVPKIADIKSANAQTVPYADVFCGGFPCQDISLAGNRVGIRDGTRSGLWFELARVIGEVRPRIVLLENVAAITTAGGGGVRVIADLAEMGYDARWGIIRASDAGAPHQRARWWCMAYRTGINGDLRSELESDRRTEQTEQTRMDGQRSMAHPPTQGLQATDATGQPTHTAQASRGVVNGPVRHRNVGHTDHARLERRREHRKHADQWATGAAGSQSRLDYAPRWQRYDVRRQSSQKNAARNRTRIGARQTQPGVGRNFARVSPRLDGYNGGIRYAISKKKRPNQVLPVVRQVVKAKTVQRKARRLSGFSPPPLLRSRVRSIRQPQRRSDRQRTQEARNAVTPVQLRTVWINRDARRSPYRWRFDERRPIQPDDVMRLMSHQMALGTWQDETERWRVLQNLREAFGEVVVGHVPETLPALQEIWRSLPDQAKTWIAVRACQDRLAETPWPAPPGPQYAWEPPRVTERSDHRASRLKALGNAVVPQVVYPLAVMIRGWLDSEAVS